MATEIRFEIEDDDQFEALKDLKDRRGYTWKGLMLEGAKALNTDEEL